MIRIDHTYDDKRVVFTAVGAASGILGRLFGGETEAGRVDDWVAGDAARCGALGALRMFGEDHPGTVHVEADRLEAAHTAVASLDANQARALGLPGRPPYVFTADTVGVIGSPDFTLTARWLDADAPGFVASAWRISGNSPRRVSHSRAALFRHRAGRRFRRGRR